MPSNNKKISANKPDFPANKLPIGTIKMGKDNNEWVILTTNGKKEWKLLGPTINKNTQNFEFGSMNTISTIIMDKLNIGKAKFLTKLKMSSRIGVGELYYNIMPAKSGMYNIYKLKNSLIAVYDKDDLDKQIFKLCKERAICDIGRFGFIDHDRLNKYRIKPVPKNKKNAELNILEKYKYKLLGIEPVSFKKTNKPIRDAFVHTRDIEPKYIKKNNDSEPIAILTDNGYGDWNFFIYKSGHNYLILSMETEITILKKMAQNIQRQLEK